MFVVALLEVDEVDDEEVEVLLLGAVSVVEEVEVEEVPDPLPEHALTVHYCGQSMTKHF